MHTQLIVRIRSAGADAGWVADLGGAVKGVLPQTRPTKTEAVNAATMAARELIRGRLRDGFHPLTGAWVAEDAELTRLRRLYDDGIEIVSEHVDFHGADVVGDVHVP